MYSTLFKYMQVQKNGPHVLLFIFPVCALKKIHSFSPHVDVFLGKTLNSCFSWCVYFTCNLLWVKASAKC